MFNSLCYEWKEVKYFKEMTLFEEAQKTKAYLEHKRISTIEPLCEYS